MENALFKAKHASQAILLPATADDSSLVASALKGAPGIYSVHYIGEKANDRDNINNLLNTLMPFSKPQHQAFFYCVLIYLAYEDPVLLICYEAWEGSASVLLAPRGNENNNGFVRYNPIFYIPTEEKIAVRLSIKINSISHRGQALRILVEKLTDKTRIRNEANN